MVRLGQAFEEGPLPLNVRRFVGRELYRCRAGFSFGEPGGKAGRDGLLTGCLAPITNRGLVFGDRRGVTTKRGLVFADFDGVGSSLSPSVCLSSLERPERCFLEVGAECKVAESNVLWRVCFLDFFRGVSSPFATPVGGFPSTRGVSRSMIACCCGEFGALEVASTLVAAIRGLSWIFGTILGLGAGWALNVRFALGDGEAGGESVPARWIGLVDVAGGRYAMGKLLVGVTTSAPCMVLGDSVCRTAQAPCEGQAESPFLRRTRSGYPSAWP